MIQAINYRTGLSREIHSSGFRVNGSHIDVPGFLHDINILSGSRRQDGFREQIRVNRLQCGSDAFFRRLQYQVITDDDRIGTTGGIINPVTALNPDHIARLHGFNMNIDG